MLPTDDVVLKSGPVICISSSRSVIHTVATDNRTNVALKIETWVIGDVVQPREGVVSMEEFVLFFLFLVMQILILNLAWLVPEHKCIQVFSPK